ncbi:endo-1,4-beta-xylanase [Streptacidiphilus carbonis]|uniref:endo-1,4-beta-xylanase n=1 Tax=Streptacidiphilus carbonis TaxID=105422 RepID=UPI000693F37D|nr:endo-1,4-beta-xylanase [Streptacidiphilus carbonis]
MHRPPSSAPSRRATSGRLRRTLLTAAVAVAAVAGATLPAAAHGGTAGRNAPLRSLAAHDGIYVGSALAAGTLASDSTYSSIAATQFDAVTPENEMKWSSVEPTQGAFDWAPADQIVSFAQDHHMLVRGHNLVWNSQLPTWLTSGSYSSAQLAALLKKHITDEVSHFKGKIYAWDVVNEPFNGDGSYVQDLWYNALGPGYIADALRWAHQADPKAVLYLNDYNIEGQNAKSDAMYALVKQLRAEGVPIGGVGLESHFIAGELPTDIKANMQRFTKLGVNVAVTELDDRVELPATAAELTQQAADYGSVVTDCVQVRGCVGVTAWEFDDGHSWVPGVFAGQGAANLYDASYQAKPAYYAVRSALAAGRRTSSH